MKILYISNFVKTYSLVFQNELSVLKELGHEIEWVANFSNFIGDTREIPFKIYNVPFNSYPFNFSNIKAFKQVKKLLKKGNYDVVVCSTPIGGTIARLAAKKTNTQKVIYCAHGFLFLKGINPFLYKIFRFHEKLLARYTDNIITITEEDYQAAKEFKLRNNGKVFFVHGAGVSIAHRDITNDERVEKRKNLNIGDKDFMLISAGYINKNKNNKVVIDALVLLNNPNVKYVICGDGPYRKKIEKYTNKKGLCKSVLFLGYRTDVEDLMLCSDAFVMPSFREGAPRALLEAINADIPCIGSNIRGISDILQKGNGGLLCNPHLPSDFSEAINILLKDENVRNFYVANSKKVIKDYSSSNVKKELYEIYKEVI